MTVDNLFHLTFNDDDCDGKYQKKIPFFLASERRHLKIRGNC